MSKTEKKKRARAVRKQLQLYVNAQEDHVRDHIRTVLNADPEQYDAGCLLRALGQLSDLVRETVPGYREVTGNDAE